MAEARTVNLPDTVGYAVPDEIKALFTRMHAEVPEVAQYGVTLAVHCHNDLGLATANTLAGAGQVECTVNGIGERAGNAHYAEVVMALKTRGDVFRRTHQIVTSEIGRTAKLVSEVIGKLIPDTLPLVGESVFAHGSGIQQHGMLQNPLTYQVMTPESVGWAAEQFPLSAQSGRHGLQKRLAILGYSVAGNSLSDAYGRFLKVATEKVLVRDTDLHILMLG